MEMDDLITARKFGNRIKKIIEEDNWIQINTNLKLSRDFTPEDSVLALSTVDLKTADQLNEVLGLWKEFMERNLQRILNENRELGVDARKSLEIDLKVVMDRFRENVFVGVSQDSHND